MEFSGLVKIPAAPPTVWAALLDPDVLKICIPGCKSVERKSETEFATAMKVKVGPLNTNFSGVIALQDLDPAGAVTLAGTLQGAAAGFARGEARVTLTASGDGTELAYTADVSIGGKLAAVGDRLFGSAVRRNVTDFFSALEGWLTSSTAGSVVDSANRKPTPVPAANGTFAAVDSTVTACSGVADSKPAVTPAPFRSL